jgi:lipid II:glycine glycyltransferase (peptidoglycan interpeptide bridge formation enzyme)
VYDALAMYVKQYLPGTVLTVEPDSEETPKANGYRRSKNTILIPRTLILDLNKSEDELLEVMTKKTRQYIRKSSREGVMLKQVTSSEEIAKCLEIYHETAARASFALHGDDYYYDVHEKLGDASVIFGAYEGEKLLSFVWLAVSGKTAFELYGGMNDRGQELRANYALKWHAIMTCKRWGIERYDMNGLLNDGVSTFKQGFAGHEDMLAGTFDYPLSPLYSVWTAALPKAKSIVRKIKSLR